MDLVTVDQGVFEEGRHGVDIVFGHLADVFEEEGEGFEDTVLDVEFGDAVLVHQSRQNGEGRTSFSHNTDGDGCTDTRLALLDPQVVEESREDILWTNSFGNKSYSPLELARWI